MPNPRDCLCSQLLVPARPIPLPAPRLQVPARVLRCVPMPRTQPPAHGPNKEHSGAWPLLPGLPPWSVPGRARDTVRRGDGRSERGWAPSSARAGPSSWLAARARRRAPSRRRGQSPRPAPRALLVTWPHHPNYVVPCQAPCPGGCTPKAPPPPASCWSPLAGPGTIRHPHTFGHPSSHYSGGSPVPDRWKCT
jgi:hypothetical protein